MAKTPDIIYDRNLADVLSRRTKPILPPETGWHKIGISQPEGISFINSWGNSGVSSAPASYYHSEDGEVRVRGKITGGSTGTSAFVLPPEVRPEYAESFVCSIEGGGYANVDVDVDGAVTIVNITLPGA